MEKPFQYDECYAELKCLLAANLDVGIMAVRPEVLSRVLEYHDALVESASKAAKTKPRGQALSDLCDFIGLLVVMALLVAPLFFIK